MQNRCSERHLTRLAGFLERGGKLRQRHKRQKKWLLKLTQAGTTGLSTSRIHLGSPLWWTINNSTREQGKQIGWRSLLWSDSFWFSLRLSSDFHRQVLKWGWTCQNLRAKEIMQYHGRNQSLHPFRLTLCVWVFFHVYGYHLPAWCPRKPEREAGLPELDL